MVQFTCSRYHSILARFDIGGVKCFGTGSIAKLPRAAPHSKLTKLAVRESGPGSSVNCDGAHPPIPKFPEGNDP